MGWTGSMLSGISSGIGGAASGVVSAVVNGVRNALTTALRVVLGVARGLILGAFQAITTGIIGIIGTIGVAVVGLSGVVVKATSSFSSMAKAINELRGATGMSAGRAGGLINRFSGFGIRPNDTAAMFENSNPLMLAMRARMFGVGDIGAPGAIPAMAARFQSMSRTPFGNRMARNMLGDMDTSAFRNILMRSPGMLREQESFQSGIQRSLGVNPAVIAHVGQQLEVVTTKFQVLSETVLIRLASDILPYLIQKFNQLATWVSGNAGNISKWIRTGVDALITGAESIFDFFTRNGPVIANAAQTAFSWVVNDLPPLLMRGGAIMLRTFGSILDGIGSFTEGLIKNLPSILETLDTVLNALRAFVGAGIGIASRLLNGFTGSGDKGNPLLTALKPKAPGIGDLMGGITRDLSSPYESHPGVTTNNFMPELLGKAIEYGPRLWRFVKGAGKVAKVAIPAYGAYRAYGAYNDFQSNGGIGGAVNGFMGAGGQQARDRFFDLVPESNLAGNRAAIEARMRQGAGYLHGGADNLRGGADWLDSQAANWKSTLAQWMEPNKERQRLDSQNLQAIAENTKLAAANSDPRYLQEYHKQAAALIASVVSQDAADRYLDLSRT